MQQISAPSVVLSEDAFNSRFLNAIDFSLSAHRNKKKGKVKSQLV